MSNDNKIPIRWTSAILDSSGYANASRGYVLALMDHPDVEISISPVSFEEQRTSHKTFEEKAKLFLDRKIDYKFNILHLTPENYHIFHNPSKYNIAYTVWETDRLPGEWVPMINKMDEVWVPSEWNKEVFKNSGIIKPIVVVPHVIEKPDTSTLKPFDLPCSEDTFVFYSIFQWIERKNPLCLLKAFLTEFSASEKVCLALKSYRINTSLQEQDIIKNEIQLIKEKLRLSNYPPIYFLGQLFPDEMISRLHMRGGCFILPHRGEGFSISHAEAMSHGKPAVGTNYSGNLDFMNQDNSYLIDYQLTPTYGMIFGKYHGKMNWADPDITHLKQIMREVFENKDQAVQRGLVGQKTIQEKLNAKVISNLIVNRLKEIG